MFVRNSGSQSYLFLLLAAAIFLSGCITVSKPLTTPTLLKTEEATHEQLMSEVNRFARVASMRAKMDLNFEDNSFA